MTLGGRREAFDWRTGSEKIENPIFGALHDQRREDVAGEDEEGGPVQPDPRPPETTISGCDQKGDSEQPGD